MSEENATRRALCTPLVAVDRQEDQGLILSTATFTRLPNEPQASSLINSPSLSTFTMPNQHDKYKRTLGPYLDHEILNLSRREPFPLEGLTLRHGQEIVGYAAIV